jgi:hypothetical protein
MFRSSWRTALRLIFRSTVEWFGRTCPGGKSDMKEMSMLRKSRREPERPMKVVALIGAVWLITLSGVAAYTKEAPTPASAAAAVSEPPPAVNILGRRG